MGRILLPALGLLGVCCLCSVMIPLLPRNASTVAPTPNLFPSPGDQVTPTPLFNFDFPTFTPFATLTFPVPSPFPTLTPPPTGSPTPIPVLPTMTFTAIIPPTSTPVPPSTATLPPPTAVSAGPVQIVAVDKPAEYVEIQNVSNGTIDLGGWRLVSETGNQACRLRGTLQPNEILRVWSGRGSPGFDCRLPNNIWNDNTPDPAVLYNPEGEEVSRFP